MHGRAGYQAALVFAVLLGASTSAARESATAAPARESVLYRFRGGHDVSVPLAGLVIDGHGTLFGTTSAGGPHNFGTLFALAPPAAGHTTWIETVLHRFRGGGDGSQPQAGVIMDPDGILYGTTINGGNTVKNLGFGTVFAFTSGEPGR